MIRSFICTCDKRIETFKRFVESYKLHAQKHLKRPIVYYDGDGDEYHSLIDSLNPRLKIKQGVFPSKNFGPYSETIDYKCIWEFPKIVAKKYPDDHILFLEDDILFSPSFGEAIQEIKKQFINYHVVDAVTLYGSGECYWPKKNNKANYPIYRFSGHDYYGNLAIIFKPSLMRWWYDHRHIIWNNNYSGWDVKIGYIFQDNGFNFYCTDKHYVQHQIGPSVIANNFKNQTSSLFKR